MNKIEVSTETVSLPSKGLIYPETSLLSKGTIEMRYMTAKEEDILTNVNYIRNGTVIDKLLQALVVTPIDFDELIIGDKNAIMIAARILGYGHEYEFPYDDGTGEKTGKVDLNNLKEKEIDESKLTKNINEFIFTLPHARNVITFKILTHGDEKKINAELKGLEKLNPNAQPRVTTRLKYMITSIDSDRDKNKIASFVNNELRAMDARALRQEYDKISPDIELKYYPDENYTGEGIEVPINANFFWPDAII